jgi:signal transduction histidine kinase
VTLLDDDQEPAGLQGVVRDITDRKAAQEALVKEAAAEARNEGLRRAIQRVVVAQEAIRRNITQQLHGMVQNRLIPVLHRLAGEIGSAPDEVPNQELQAILSDNLGILEHDIRDISRQLYPAILRQGIIPAVQSLTDQFESIMPVGLELGQDLVTGEGWDRGLVPESIRLALYRVAEEALNNVAKHAGATKVAVTLDLDNDMDSSRLSVRDDGRGFDVDSMTASVGIAGMRDYADTMGGTCVISSGPREGTMVKAEFPIAEPVAANALRDGPSG